MVNEEKMTEYINKAEILKETICKGILCSECSFNNDVKGARCKLIRYINELPTINIVHCSECRHAEELMTGKWCCDISSLCQRGTFFCADGEREEKR